MRLVGTAESLADPLGKLISAEQPLGLYTFLLPWIHLGSIALSQGLFLGSKQGTICTPASLPLFLTPLLCSAIQLLTSLDVCQLALSQIIRATPSCPSRRAFGSCTQESGW